MDAGPTAHASREKQGAESNASRNTGMPLLSENSTGSLLNASNFLERRRQPTVTTSGKLWGCPGSRDLLFTVLFTPVEFACGIHLILTPSFKTHGHVHYCSGKLSEKRGLSGQ